MMQFYIAFFLALFNYQVFLCSGQEHNNEKNEPTDSGGDYTTSITTVEAVAEAYTESLTDDLSDVFNDTDFLLDANDTEGNDTSAGEFDEYEDTDNSTLAATTVVPLANVTDVPPQIPNEILESELSTQDFCLCDLQVSCILV